MLSFGIDIVLPDWWFRSALSPAPALAIVTYSHHSGIENEDLSPEGIPPITVTLTLPLPLPLRTPNPIIQPPTQALITTSNNAGGFSPPPDRPPPPRAVGLVSPLLLPRPPMAPAIGDKVGRALSLGGILGCHGSCDLPGLYQVRNMIILGLC